MKEWGIPVGADDWPAYHEYWGIDRSPYMKDPLEQHCREVIDRTWNYAGRIKNQRDHTLNAVLGLGGEAGEVVDLHKKMYYHTEKDRRQELKEELGDLCFYLAKVLDLYGWSLDEILKLNKQKLFARHDIVEK